MLGFFKKINKIIGSKIGWLNLLKIIIGTAIFFSFLWIISKEIDPDLGWHLKTGEWIVNNKSVPHFDQFSWTMSGFRWVDHEWLPEALLWLAYSKNLWWLAILFFTFFAYGPFLFWIKKAKSLFGLVFLVLAAAAFINMIGIRPQVPSFFIFFIVVTIIWSRFTKKLSGRQLKLYAIFLPLTFFIWANLHAGFFSGLVFFAIIIFLNLIAGFLKKHLENFNWRLDLPVFLASFGVTLLNPYGPGLYREIFVVVFSSETTRYISEWLSPFMFLLPEMIAVISISSFLFLINWKKYRIDFLAAALLFLTLFIKSIRMMPLFFVAAMPLVSQGIAWVEQDIREAQTKRPFNKNQKLVVKAAAGLIAISSFVLFGWKATHYNIFQTPQKAVIFLEQYLKNNQNKKILNDYGLGGYIIWKAPGIKVFIDGRMPHWVDEQGNSAMKDYVKIFYKGEDGWKEVFGRRQIDLVLTQIGKIEQKEGFIQKYTPEFLKKYIKQRVGFLLNLIGVKRQINLEESLVQNSWQIIYEDDLAAIIKKP